MEIDHVSRKVKSVKIIDFGTSFAFEDINQKLELTTPEYLPPEILEQIEGKQKNLMGFGQQKQHNLANNLKTSTIDIWSFGAILLELVIGFPIWMSYKGRIVRGENNSTQLMSGIFGVQQRAPIKIIKLQIAFIQKLP